MCFVWISEQRKSVCFPYVALIGSYFASWMESVYCAVRAETLHTNQLNIRVFRRLKYMFVAFSNTSEHNKMK
jgi:hypothetical protein